MAVGAIDWETVYKEYEPKVRAYIYNRVNDPEDVNDLCSDVFLKLMQKKDELMEMPGAVSTRIFLITKSRVIDFYRTHKVKYEIPEAMTDGMDLEQQTIDKETLESLADALEQLETRLRDIIVLHYYGEKKLTEIAEAMGMSYRNIKILHKKALENLKKLMD